MLEMARQKERWVGGAPRKEEAIQTENDVVEQVKGGTEDGVGDRRTRLEQRQREGALERNHRPTGEEAERRVPKEHARPTRRSEPRAGFSRGAFATPVRRGHSDGFSFRR